VDENTLNIILRQRLSNSPQVTGIWSSFIWVQEEETSVDFEGNAISQQVWNHRYFVLHGNGKFEYYLTPNKNFKKGEGSIAKLTEQGYTVQTDRNNTQITFHTPEKNWCFQFEHPQHQEEWIKFSQAKSNLEKIIKNARSKSISKIQDLVKQAQENKDNGIWRGCIYIEEETLAERAWFHRYVILHENGNFEFYKKPNKVTKIGEGSISELTGKYYTQKCDGHDILITTFHTPNKNWRFQFEHVEDRKFWTTFCDTNFEFPEEDKIALDENKNEEEMAIRWSRTKGQTNANRTYILRLWSNRYDSFLKQTTQQPKKGFCSCCKKNDETIRFRKD
jgi:hypothetical protein